MKKCTKGAIWKSNFKRPGCPGRRRQHITVACTLLMHCAKLCILSRKCYHVFKAKAALFLHRFFAAGIMPGAAAAAAPVIGNIRRQLTRALGEVFNGIFRNGTLTTIQKCKQWQNCVVYAAGKVVQRMPTMDTPSLNREMNKAYYCQLQVLFADVDDNTSYWARHFGFDCTFASMMAHVHGSNGRPAILFFDYGNNEDLDSGQIDAAKSDWTSAHLWTKYHSLKTEMQNQMLPTLMKQRIKAVVAGDAYEFATGGCFAEVFYDWTGAMFQIDANSKFQERARKRARAASANPRAAAAENVDDAGGNQGEENENNEAADNIPEVNLRAVDQPEVWGDEHFAWRHPLTFVFVLNGPLTYFHPDASSRQVCEFLKRVPRSGPSDMRRPVQHSDSRSVQRAQDRNRAIADSDSRNDNFLSEIRQSRQGQMESFTTANELQQIQIEMELASHQQQNQTAHITKQQVALRALSDDQVNLPQLSLQQRQRLTVIQQSYIESCLLAGEAAQVAADPFAPIALRLARLNGSSASPLPTAPRPLQNSDAAVPRRRSSVPRANLHASFQPSNAQNARGAAADSSPSSSP
jgi:hypothetical protein